LGEALESGVALASVNISPCMVLGLASELDLLWE
jgi:hypothetical protein